MQPVARLKLTASASGSFKASITLKKDARIALDNARVEYEPGKGLPKFSLRASNNLNNLQIQKVALLQGSATLTGKYPNIIVSQQDLDQIDQVKI